MRHSLLRFVNVYYARKPSLEISTRLLRLCLSLSLHPCYIEVLNFRFLFSSFLIELVPIWDFIYDFDYLIVFVWKMLIKAKCIMASLDVFMIGTVNKTLSYLGIFFFNKYWIYIKKKTYLVIVLLIQTKTALKKIRSAPTHFLTSKLK